MKLENTTEKRVLKRRMSTQKYFMWHTLTNWSAGFSFPKPPLRCVIKPFHISSVLLKAAVERPDEGTKAGRFHVLKEKG